MAYTRVSGSIEPRALNGSADVSGSLGLSPKFPETNPVQFSFGTGLGKVNLLGYKEGSAAGAAATIDLTTITDPVGTALNFARVKAVGFYNLNTTDTHILLLDGTVSNAWKALFNAIATAKLVIPPGATINGLVVPGLVIVAAPNATSLAVSGTSKVISLDPGANTISYRVALLGNDV